jgi:hypothetical protein
MSDTQAEQDMRAAFEAIYAHAQPYTHERKELAWQMFHAGAFYERRFNQSPTANPRVETPVPDAKCQQGPGECDCRDAGEPDPRLAGLVKHLAKTERKYASRAMNTHLRTAKAVHRAAQQKFARWREGVEELMGKRQP